MALILEEEGVEGVEEEEEEEEIGEAEDEVVSVEVMFKRKSSSECMAKILVLLLTRLFKEKDSTNSLTPKSEKLKM